MFAHLDELGGGSMLEGCIRGIEDNWFQGRIADSAYELERKLNEGGGSSSGSTPSPRATTRTRSSCCRSPTRTSRQLKRLEQVRHVRDRRRGRCRPRPPRQEAADPEVNLMPALIDAVRPTPPSAR